jgi:hypothetical protein
MYSATNGSLSASNSAKADAFDLARVRHAAAARALRALFAVEGAAAKLAYLGRIAVKHQGAPIGITSG